MNFQTKARMGISVKKRVFFLLAVLVVLSGCGQMPAKGVDVQSEDSAQTESTMQMDDRVIIALLDTGVSTKAISGEQLLSGYNYVTDSTDTEDLINHGTAVASVILGCESAGVEGMAQDAFLVPLVVCTKKDGKMDSVSPEILARAIRDSVDVYGADIINVSLGIRKDDGALLEAVEYAEEKGVLVVAAVGNDGIDGRPYYPAAYDTVLAVGSCDAEGNMSEFTQSGFDVLAPGEDILLASRNGKTYGARGSSYATGFISADAANLLKEEPALTPRELCGKIKYLQ